VRAPWQLVPYDSPRCAACLTAPAPLAAACQAAAAGRCLGRQRGLAGEAGGGGGGGERGGG
jgi:hypothetical protein